MDSRTRSATGSTCSSRRPIAGEVSLERLERRGAQAFGVGGDGRERRREHAREVEIVEPDHRQVPRDPRPAFARGQVHAAGEDVVVAEHRGHVLFEQRPRARAASSNVNAVCTVGGVRPSRSRIRSRRRSNVGASNLDARWPISRVRARAGGPSRVDARLDVEPHHREPCPGTSRSGSRARSCPAAGRPRTAAGRRRDRRAAPAATRPPTRGRCRCRRARRCSRRSCAARWAPRSTRPKNGFVMSGTTSATLRATPSSARAATFGR